MVLLSNNGRFAHWIARAILFLVLTAGYSAANAATTIVPPANNVNVNPSSTTHVSSCVAINPTNPKNAVCCSGLDNASGGLTKGVSTNSGASWTASTIAIGTDFPAASGSPACSWDNFGNLFLVYLDTTGNNVEVLLSTDGGTTFTLIQTFSGLALSLPKVSTGPDATSTTGGTSVWVAYYDGTNGGIFCSGAAVGALGLIGSFGVAQGIPGTPNVIMGDVAVAPSGAVVVSFQTGGMAQGPTGILTSTDPDGLGPLGFAAARNVATTNIGIANLIPAQNVVGITATPGIAYDRSGGVNNGRLYCVFTTATSPGGTDTNVVVAFSNNNGFSWSAPVKVNDDATTSSQFFPRIAVDQFTGNVAVSFYDCRNDTGAGGVGDTDNVFNTDAQFYGTVSLNGGVSFQPNVRLSAGTSNAAKSNARSPNAVDFGSYTGLAYFNGVFISTWSDNSNSTLDNPTGVLGNLNLYTTSTTVTFVPALTINSKLPDLFVNSIVIAAKPVAGYPFTFQATISNGGPGDAGPFYVSAFSTPGFATFLDKTQTNFAIPDPTNPHKVDTQYIPGLASGASITVLLTMEYDVAGDQTIAVIVDSQRDVTENNELNNLLTQRLLVYSFGKDIAVRAIVDPVTLQVYPAMVSSVPNVAIAGSPAGATEVGTTVTITTALAHGFLVGEQVVISGIAISGYNGTFTITSVPTPTSFTYTSGLTGLPSSGGGAAGVPGINARFDFTLVNLGNQPTGNFTVGIYYNRATPPTLLDVPDATIPVLSMATGAILPLTFNLPTQSVARGGRAWVFADYQDVVPEVVETNNIASAVWGVPNDAPAILSPTTASPTTAQIGQVVTFTVGAGDPNGDTLFYNWDFGDGTGIVAGGSTITHVFATVGLYTVTAIVSDGPFTNVTSVVTIQILDDQLVDLGFVIAKAGYIKLRVPFPFGTAKASIVSATELNSTVTITTLAPHKFIVGQPLSISRSGVRGYNGKFAVQSVPSSTTFTYFTQPNLLDSTGGVATPLKIKAKATIIQGSAGANVTLKNQILSGVPGAPGVYTFTVEYFAPKYKINLRIRYMYTVL